MKVNTSKFCQDYFWDQDLFWNADRLQFSQCFRDSIVLIVCGFFWIFCLPWILWLWKKSNSIQSNSSTSWLLVSKLIVNVGLLAMVSWSVYVKKINEDFLLVDLLYSIGFPLTLLLCIFLTLYEKRKKCKSSLVQSLFWPFLLIVSIPTILHLAQNYDDIKSSEVIAECFVFAFVLCMTILNSFADLSGQGATQNIAPKYLASYASSLLFGWFDPLVIKGYKNPLVQNDLPPTPDSVEVNENVEAFMKHWTNFQLKNKVDFSSIEPRKRLSLGIPLLKAFGFQFGIGNLIGLFHYSVTFTSPMVSQPTTKYSMKLIENLLPFNYRY